MKSDVDFKDPVLAARQVRPKTSKSDVIRGRRSVRGTEKPPPEWGV